MAAFQKFQFPLIITVLQVLFLILFAVFGKYEDKAHPPSTDDASFVNTNYPLFQDVHTMAIIGFGFVMAFLRRYGFSSVSLNLLLVCFVIQMSMIIRGFLSDSFAKDGKFTICLTELIKADMDAITIVIAMGAVLGKLTPIQYIIMAIIGVPLAVVLDHVVFQVLMVNDIGRSMVIHVFGAIFGVAVARGFVNPITFEHPHRGGNYNSYLFSFVGGLFLFIFYPSFNAALAKPENARHRAILNSYLALCSCAVMTFVMSHLLDREKKGRFTPIHVANSIIAGGVAIGTVANIILEPVFAVLIGFLAAVVSVVGYQVIAPVLLKKLRIDDTRGVLSAHALPGILAGFLGFIFVFIYDPARYGDSLKFIYPALKTGTEAEDRDVSTQAVFQLVALLIAILVALIGGLITGILLKLKFLNQYPDKEFFSDLNTFDVPEDFDFTTRIISKIDHVELTEHSALTSKEKENNEP